MNAAVHLSYDFVFFQRAQVATNGFIRNAKRIGQKTDPAGPALLFQLAQNLFFPLVGCFSRSVHDLNSTRYHATATKNTQNHKPGS